MTGTSDETGMWVAAALTAAVITTLFLKTVGKRIARRSRIVAVLAGTLFAPALIMAAAVALLVGGRQPSPPHDASGMAFVALTIIAICLTPVSLVTSALWAIAARRARP